jgi:hypothetical protein
MYGSDIVRVPPDIQSVIFQLFFPFTFIINILLGTKYNKQEYTVLFIVSIGLIICITPILIDATSNTLTLYNLIWICVFILGVLFNVFANIYQNNRIDNTVNSLSILFYGKIYQLFFTLCFFWINIIKEIGYYDSLNNWSISFVDNVNCYFIDCNDTWYLGLINAACSNIMLLTLIYLINNVNSSYIGIINAIASPLTIIIWFFIIETAIYRLILEIIGMIFIIIGLIIYANVLKKEQVIPKEINEIISPL